MEAARKEKEPRRFGPLEDSIDIEAVPLVKKAIALGAGGRV
jgi:hypothetical protein